MAIEFLPDVIAPTPNVPLTAMIGGTAAHPFAPTVTTILAGLATQKFVPDHRARFFYFIDGSGNLLRWDASTPSVAPVQIVAASALGAVNYIDISPDNSTLYATVGNTVISILTTAPYTVATVASGFGGAWGIAFDVVAGNLRVWDAAAGGPAVVTLAGVVTQHGGIVGGIGTALAVGKSGTVYFPDSTAIKQAPGGANATVDNGYYHCAPCVDDDEPGEACLYYFTNAASAPGSGGDKLVRLTLNSGAKVLSVATTAALVSVGDNVVPVMFFRNDSYDPQVNPALYVVDTAGNLNRIEA